MCSCGVSMPVICWSPRKDAESSRAHSHIFQSLSSHVRCHLQAAGSGQDASACPQGAQCHGSPKGEGCASNPCPRSVAGSISDVWVALVHAQAQPQIQQNEQMLASGISDCTRILALIDCCYQKCLSASVFHICWLIRNSNS